MSRTFLDALNERYGGDDDTNAYSEDAFDVGATRSKAKINKKWEMVGMEKARQKQSNHSRLSVLGLQNCNISIAEIATGQIAAAGLKRVRELNLSDNDGLTAVEIDRIISALPNLVELQLSGTGVSNVSLWSPAVAELAAVASDSQNDENDDKKQQQQQQGFPKLAQSASNIPLGASVDSLANPTSPLGQTGSRPTSPFIHNHWSRLTTLALNRCNLSWSAVLEAFPCNLSSLVSLHLESNGIGKIFPPSIRRTASQNHVALITASCATNEPVDDENAPATASPSLNFKFVPMFPALKELNLSFNAITTLNTDPDMLRFLEHDTPNLTSLNLTGNRVALTPPVDEKEVQTLLKETCYLSRLEVLYVTQNAPLVSNCAFSIDNNDGENRKQHDEPLVALDWIRKFCPKLKSFRVTYSDLFGENASRVTDIENSFCPVCHLSEIQQRLLVIASVSQIDTLNSGPVRQKERMDAEMLYLQAGRGKKEHAERQQKEPGKHKVGSAVDRFFPFSNFPLLEHLSEKHKSVVLTSLANGAGTTGSATSNALSYTLQLTFRILKTEKRNDVNTNKEKITIIPVTEDVTRNVPGNMTVGKLKSFVASIFPGIAEIPMQKKVQAIAVSNDVGGGNVSATMLASVDDENALILCGVPSTAIVEVFV